MKVIEHIENAKNPLFSFEIVPPMRGRTIQDIVDVVKKLAPYEPPWIDVTAHSAAAFYNERPDGTVERRIYKKRPGTIGICGIIQNRFKIDTVTHLLCQGFTQEETEDALIELNYLGIHNILALRGDGLNYKKQVSKDRKSNFYASDLVEQIHGMNKGIFLEEIDNATPFNFCVGVAGYPEKHFEAPNLKTDIDFLKKKIDAGADYVVSQMFFDSSKFIEWDKMCKESGITVPLVPGLKIIKSVRQLTSLPKNFYINLPDELVSEIMENQDHVREIGIRWAIKQATELLEYGVPCVHFYVMNDADGVLEVINKLR